MRITNTMMTNGAMTNMGKNKVAFNKYFQQYSTQKKIQKPSDDPIVAVRSLKFRARLAELDQYLNKNIPDARSWMESTESALVDINKTMTNMFDYCDQAANGTLTTSDRATILATLQQYSQSVYEQGVNSDFAGRYLFTGYRTDVPLLFDRETTNLKYTINETLSANDIYPTSFAYKGPEYSAAASATDYALNAPEFPSANVMMLSYNKLDDVDITLEYKDASGNMVQIPSGTFTLTKTSMYDPTITDYNGQYKPGDNEVYFIPETGEVVFGKNVYAAISESKEINVSYQKTNFDKGAIRPEHYFECDATNNLTGTTTNYRNPDKQNIDYQINFSQTLTVNTLASNAVDMSIARAVDNVANIINEISITEAALKDVNKKIAECDINDTTKKETLEELKKQINNKLKLQEEMLTNSYTKAMTVCKEAQDKLNITIAELGARMNRLSSTEAKLEDQEISFTDALSENEDVELGDAYIRFNQADLLYQATLQATSKTLGNSLLDFL